MWELFSAYILSEYGALGGAAILTCIVFGYRRMPEKYKTAIKEAAKTFMGFRTKH